MTHKLSIAMLLILTLFLLDGCKSIHLPPPADSRNALVVSESLTSATSGIQSTMALTQSLYAAIDFIDPLSRTESVRITETINWTSSVPEPFTRITEYEFNGNLHRFAKIDDYTIEQYFLGPDYYGNESGMGWQKVALAEIQPMLTNELDEAASLILGGRAFRALGASGLISESSPLQAEIRYLQRGKPFKYSGEIVTIYSYITVIRPPNRLASVKLWVRTTDGRPIRAQMHSYLPLYFKYRNEFVKMDWVLEYDPSIRLVPPI